MNQTEVRVDSAQQAPEFNINEFKIEYTKLINNHLILRTAMATILEWILNQLRMSRELARSESLKVINELIDYLESTIPDVKKAQKRLQDDIEAARRAQGKEVTQS